MSNKQYLTYSEYEQLGGKIDQAAYVRFEMQARKTIDYYTSMRIADDFQTVNPETLAYYESLKLLMVELIDLVQAADMTGEQIASESNSGISRSFVTHTAEQLNDKQYQLIRQYLSGEISSNGVSLLYLGV